LDIWGVSPSNYHFLYSVVVYYPDFTLIFSQNLMRGEPLKLVDGGQSQRTFVYIKDAIEAVLRMIVSTSGSILLLINLEVEHERLVSRVFFFICLELKGQCRLHKLLLNICVFQENPARANGHIFNVGNPHNELTVRELAELMTDVSACRSPTPGVCMYCSGCFSFCRHVISALVWLSRSIVK
jgi:UDP-apiose/xylose synthase